MPFVCLVATKTRLRRKPDNDYMQAVRKGIHFGQSLATDCLLRNGDREAYMLLERRHIGRVSHFWGVRKRKSPNKEISTVEQERNDMLPRRHSFQSSDAETIARDLHNCSFS